MPNKTPVITTLKSNRELIIRKALIIGAAAAGIIIAGAVVFAATAKDEEFTLPDSVVD